MQRFKYKFKVYMYVVMAAALILAFTTIGMSVYRFVVNGYNPSKLLGIVVTFIISVVIIVLIFSIIFSSYYEINDRDFVLKWGLLQNKIPVSDISKTIHNPKTNQLTVVFGKDDNFMVISVYDIDPLTIVDALREKNKKIMFESYIPPEDDKKKKGKK